MTKINYSFIEYGKQFLPGGGASDFFELAYTSNFSGNIAGTARALRTSMQIPDYVKTPFQFFPGCGASVVFLAPPYQDEMMLCLIQPRRENEMNSQSGMTRPFYQIRLHLVEKMELWNALQAGDSVFRDLFLAGIAQNSAGVYRLRDYSQIEPIDTVSVTKKLSLVTPETSLAIDNEGRFADPSKIAALVNPLADFFVESRDSRARMQLRIVGDLSIDQKFAIVDALQRLLMPVFPGDKGQNFLTFAFDYATMAPVHVLFLRADEVSRVSSSGVTTKTVFWPLNAVDKPNENTFENTFTYWIKRGLYDRWFLFGEVFSDVLPEVRITRKEDYQLLDWEGMAWKPTDVEIVTFPGLPLPQRQYIVNHKKGLDFLRKMAALKVEFWQWFENLLLREDLPADFFYDAVHPNYWDSALESISSPSFDVKKVQILMERAWDQRPDFFPFLIKMIVACPALDIPVKVDVWLLDYVKKHGFQPKIYDILKMLPFTETRLRLGLLSGREDEFWRGRAQENERLIRNIGICFLLGRDTQSGFGYSEALQSIAKDLLEPENQDAVLTAWLKYDWNAKKDNFFRGFSLQDGKFWRSQKDALAISLDQILQRYLRTSNAEELSQLVGQGLFSLGEFRRLKREDFWLTWLRLAEANPESKFMTPDDTPYDVPYELSKEIRTSDIETLFARMRRLVRLGYSPERKQAEFKPLFGQIIQALQIWNVRLLTLKSLVGENTFLFFTAIHEFRKIQPSLSLGSQDIQFLLEIQSDEARALVAELCSQGVLPHSLSESAAEQLAQNAKLESQHKRILLTYLRLWYQQSDVLLWKALNWSTYLSDNWQRQNEFSFWLNHLVKQAGRSFDEPALTALLLAWQGKTDFWQTAKKTENPETFFVLAINAYFSQSPNAVLVETDAEKIRQAMPGLLNAFFPLVKGKLEQILAPAPVQEERASFKPTEESKKDAPSKTAWWKRFWAWATVLKTAVESHPVDSPATEENASSTLARQELFSPAQPEPAKQKIANQKPYRSMEPSGYLRDQVLNRVFLALPVIVLVVVAFFAFQNRDAFSSLLPPRPTPSPSATSTPVLSTSIPLSPPNTATFTPLPSATVAPPFVLSGVDPSLPVDFLIFDRLIQEDKTDILCYPGLECDALGKPLLDVIKKKWKVVNCPEPELASPQWVAYTVRTRFLVSARCGQKFTVVDVGGDYDSKPDVAFPLYTADEYQPGPLQGISLQDNVNAYAFTLLENPGILALGSSFSSRIFFKFDSAPSPVLSHGADPTQLTAEQISAYGWRKTAAATSLLLAVYQPGNSVSTLYQTSPLLGDKAIDSHSLPLTKLLEIPGKVILLSDDGQGNLALVTQKEDGSLDKLLLYDSQYQQVVEKDILSVFSTIYAIDWSSSGALFVSGVTQTGGCDAGCLYAARLDELKAGTTSLHLLDIPGGLRYFSVR